ncbi:hypothetical protein ACFU93_37490 [Streptomyces sp. NPDC057611]|uniref:hypothetical protein n=1 Tax=Streptomyces sp. NPDC057611 TaxID=3346182 RepID=UPI0036C2B4EC
MSHESIHEHLLISARKWASTAVDAYLEEPIDQDFAVHHMAVAVEHASKAYLASITPVLLASEKQPSVDDLLVLSGNEDRTKKGRAGLKTIGGEGAILRAAQLLGPEHKAPAKLKELRESRNGITHMGWGQPVTECRALLAAGIEHINALLKALSAEPDNFWGTYLEACTALVAQAMTEMEIRYHAKLRQARERFAETTRRLSEAEIAELVSSLSALPTAAPWPIAVPAECPACGHTGFASGRDKSGEYGAIWFLPRHFGCRLCGLTLTTWELDLAGIKGQILNDDEEPDPDWEPDFETY